MKQIKPTIVLTGGGSGGHITPLLPLARELKENWPDYELVYIGYKGDKFESLQAKHSFDYLESLQAGKFRRYHGESFLSHLLDIKTIILNIRDFFRVTLSIGKAYRLLGKYKPAVVFSKGGFVVVPVGIAARLRRIPIVTHDSDTVPGLANKIVGRWATFHATGMPAKYYSYPKEKTVFVGIPIDEQIKEVGPSLQAEYKQGLGLGRESKVLLIAGGGNGSRRLNELVVAVAPKLFAANDNLKIVHIAGAQHERTVRDEYQKSLTPTDQKRVKVLGFTPDFYKYSGAADLIISRAGATALAEFAAAAKACIIIPSPFLAAGHQLKNAQELEEKQAAVIINNEASSDELLGAVNRLLADDAYRHKLAVNLHDTIRAGAAKELAELLIKVAHQGELGSA